MLILKYFAIVGPTLSALLLAWSAYLTAPADPGGVIGEATKIEPVSPAPAPSFDEQSALAAAREGEPVTVPPVRKTVRAHSRKVKRATARSQNIHREGSYAAPRADQFSQWR